MSAKNVLQKHWNGSAWVELHPVTKASNVFTQSGESVESQLAQLMNDWDFGLITSSPTSTDDFGSIV